MRSSAKVLLTALLFAAAVGLVALAAAVELSWPLFVAAIPLLAVPWVLTRPEPDREQGGAGSDAPDRPPD